MTSRRKLQRELEELGEETLSALPPESRLKLMIQSQAAGNEELTDRLRETIPERDYRGIDHEYKQQATVAVIMAKQAVYELHLSFMEYELAKSESQKMLLSSLARPPGDVGEEPVGEGAVHEAAESEDVEVTEDAAEALGEQDVHDVAMQGGRRHLRQAATFLYVDYHAYKRFAEEQLDIELAELLEWTPTRTVPSWAKPLDGVEPEKLMEPTPCDFTDIDLESIISQAEEQELISDPVIADTGDSTEEIALEELVEREYQELVSMWGDDATGLQV